MSDSVSQGVDMTSTRKYLIVNADDFGQSAGVTRGIIEAHERGIVTSTSLLVRWPAATEAARYARAHPGLAVGLHLDFGEWVLDGGGWRQLYRTVDVHDLGQVRSEALTTARAFPEFAWGRPHASRFAPARAPPGAGPGRRWRDCRPARNSVAALRCRGRVLRRLLWAKREWGTSPGAYTRGRAPAHLP